MQLSGEIITVNYELVYYVAENVVIIGILAYPKIKQVFNFFSTIGLVALIKNIKQNIGENFVQCWFYETSIKTLR